MKRLLTTLLSVLFCVQAFSVTTVRPANDETLCIGSGFITLDSILIVEGGDGDFNPATAGKYYLKAPANFEFSDATLSLTATSDISNLSYVLVPTNDTLILTLDITTGGGLDSIRIVGLQIQATGAPVALDTIRAVMGPNVVNMNGNGYNASNLGINSHGRVSSLNNESPSVDLGVPTLTICQGDNASFTATPTDGGGSPQYEFFILRTGSVQGLSSTATYSTTALQDGDTVVVEMTNSSICASPNLVRDTVFVTVNSIPNQPSTITGNASVCDATNTNAYSVTNDPNVVTYNWNYTGTGATLNGTGNAIDFDFAGGATSGNVEVTGTNACGTGTARTLSVTMNSIPAQPSTITGGAEQCENTTGHTYSVTNDASVVTYNWSYTGTGETINGSGNSVDYDFASGATNGNIEVSGTNTCGTGTSRTLALTIRSIPSAPSAINGDNDVCQGESGITYDVTNDVNVDTYNWNYSGAGGTVNGSGNAITIDYSGSATGGDVQVYGDNVCGTGPTTTRTITIRTPSGPNPISGNASPNCGGTESYSVVLRAGSSFNWVVPSDVTINTGQGLNVVNLTFGTIDSVLTMVETDVNGCDIVGTFSYTQVGCGLDAEFNASTTTPCLGNIVTFTDATGAGGGATYSWDFGSNATPTTATGIGPHDVYFTTTGAQDISLSVTDGATNVESKTGYINVGTAPVTDTIDGPAKPSCNQTGVVYTVQNTAGSTYDWTVSAAGASIVAGDGTNSIVVDFADSDGFIKVVETDSNGCTAEGYYSGYLSFDGGDYADLGGGNDLDTYDGSVALWLRTSTDFSGDAMVYYGSATGTNEDGDGTGLDIEMHINFNSSEQIEFFLDAQGGGSTNINFQSSSSYADGNWHHVAVSWDHDQSLAYMYIDGNQVDGRTDFSGSTREAFDELIRLGRPGANSKYFTGDIDEVSSWDRLLTPQEIRSLYNSASSPIGSSIAAELLTNYQFEEGTGDPLIDSSGNGSNGSLPGGGSKPSRGYVAGNQSPIDKIQAMGINLLGCGISANFSITGGGTNDTTICSNNNLTFTNTSAGTTGSTTYEWDFDFNNTGVSISPSSTSNTIGPHTLYITSPTTEVVTARLIITQGIIKDTAYYDYIVNSKPIVVLDNTIDVACFGSLTGQAMVSTTAGDGSYTYNWTNASYGSIGKPDNDTVTALGAGSYGVIVTDGVSCKDSTTFSITEPGSAVSVSITGYNLSAFGANDGAAKANTTGGVAPYSYNWEPEGKIGYPSAGIDGMGRDTIGELEDGLFTLTVTDNNGCTDNENVNIIAPADLIAGTIDINSTTDQFRTLCKGDKLEVVTNLTSPSGGASGGAGYSYYWQYSTNSFTWTTFPSSIDANTFDPDTAFNNNSLLFVRRCVIDNPQTKCTDPVVYEYKDTLTPTINPLPTNDQFCINETSVAIEGSIRNASSVFTALSGVTDLGNGFAELDPSSLTPGTYPVEYFITSTDNCTSRVIDSFTVNALPTPDFSGLQSSYSPASDKDTLIPDITTTGGTFSGNGIEPGTNIFNPAWPNIVEDQVDTVYYTYTHPTTGCSNVAKKTFIVSNNLATVTNVSPDPVLQTDYCVDQGILRMTVNKPSVVYPTTAWYIDNNPVGFVYMSADLDTVHLDVSGLSSGRHEVYFDFGDGATNLTSAVYAFDNHALPTIQVPTVFQSSVCEDVEDIYVFNHITKPSVGTWAFTGSTGILDAFSDGQSSNDTIFRPGDGTVGSTDTLAFTLTQVHGPASCVAVYEAPVQIKALPNPVIVGFQADNQYCTNDPSDTLYASPSGSNISWKGIGASTQINPTTRIYKPVVSLANQTDTVSYTVTVNGCTNTYERIITIDSIPSASILGGTNQICQEDTLNLEGLVGGATAIDGFPSYFIGQGIIDPDTTDGIARLSANLATPGDDYLIQFVYQNSQLCTDTGSFVLDVKPLHTISFVTEDSASSYCSNQAKVNFNTDAGGEPGSSLFSYDGGARTSNSEFNPQTAGIGQTIVEFFHLSSNTQCEAYFVDTFTVFAAPSADFDLSGVCIADTTQFTDQTTISTGGIVEWFWDFHELQAGADTSNIQNPRYKYSTDGDKWIKLIVDSDNGCVDSIRKILTFESNPEADFSWTNECEGDVTQFLTTTNSSVARWFWDYGDGSADTVNGALGDTLHQFNAANAYTVSLVVESIDGCTDTLVNVVDVREFIDFSTQDFRFHDFESGTDGWVSQDSMSTWQLGVVPSTSYIIDDAASGSHAYVTNLSGNYNNNENYAVSGPCYDFSLIEKPMIKIKYKSGIFDNDDGAVLQYQYTYSGNDSTIAWTNLGDFDNGTTTGINWYNSASIDSKPGGIFTRGWTGVSTEGSGASLDTTWLEARHHLDFLKNITGITNVRFRVAFASDASSTGPGFAFDDIWVGNRTRIVLAEHFTNNSNLCSTCEAVDTKVDTLVSKNSAPRDVIDIQYHTNTPGDDPLFAVNTQDPNARTLYYSIPSIPYMVMDGNQYEGSSSTWADDSLYVRLRSLIDPQFDIRVGYELDGNTVNVDVEMVSNDSITNQDLSIRVGLIEKRVTAVGTNGDTEFRNVLRKMLPTAAGRNLKSSWSAINDTVVESYSHNLFNFDDSDQLAVVAFIQNNQTKEVYQASFKEVAGTITGLPDYIPQELGLDFIIYPNPGSTVTNILFKEQLQEDVVVQLYNSIGQVVYAGQLDQGANSGIIDISNIPSGVYFLRTLVSDKVAGMRKLIIEN